jgi:hypothetical protein
MIEEEKPDVELQPFSRDLLMRLCIPIKALPYGHGIFIFFVLELYWQGLSLSSCKKFRHFIIYI